LSKPEDLPVRLTIIQSFRVKGMECKAGRHLYFFLFIYRSSHKKISTNEKFFIVAAVIFSSHAQAQQDPLTKSLMK
jgi:hypothetical protein